MIRHRFIANWQSSEVILLETKERFIGYCPGAYRSTDFFSLIHDGSEWGLSPPPGISVWTHTEVAQIRYTISDMDAFTSWAVANGHMNEEEQAWLLTRTTLRLASDE